VSQARTPRGTRRSDDCLVGGGDSKFAASRDPNRQLAEAGSVKLLFKTAAVGKPARLAWITAGIDEAAMPARSNLATEISR
jgi:hypothetical protein